MTTTRTATGVALHSSSLIPSGGNGFDMLARCLSLNRRCYNLTLPICAVTREVDRTLPPCPRVIHNEPPRSIRLSAHDLNGLPGQLRWLPVRPLHRAPPVIV